jgi:hypothetical protein
MLQVLVNRQFEVAPLDRVDPIPPVHGLVVPGHREDQGK